MRHTVAVRLSTLLMSFALVAGVVFAQDTSSQRILPNNNPSEKGILPCHAETNFEAEKYTVAHVSVNDPFKFLYWLQGKTKNIETQLRSRLDNQPFTYHLAENDALSVIDNARFAPNNVWGFSVSVELVSVQNCNAQTKTLDLIYRIYSTNPAKILGGGPESQATLQKSPQTSTGMSDTGNPFHLTPTGGYNRSYDIFGGGNFQMTPRFRGFHWFDMFSVDAEGSSSMRRIASAFNGSEIYHGWIRSSDWRVNYLNYSLPAGVTRLNNASLSGQFDIESRAFWKNAVTARFGGLLTGGNTQSSALPVNLLPPKTVSNAGYGALRSYAGLSSRTSHDVFSISYGMELGSIGPSSQVDWRKYIGDIGDEFWIPIGDHKPFEVESRFTVGSIQVVKSIPLSSLFFGGNAQDYFIPGNSWQILDSPYIRAIPANRFYLTSQGAGATSFKSVNLTLSYPVKSLPVMPKDLSTDPEFNSLLQAQIVSAASAEQNYYSWKDPKFQAVFANLPTLKQQLDAMQKAVDNAHETHPNQLQDQFDDCGDSIKYGAALDVTNALSAKASAQYAYVSALLPVDSNDLQSVEDACAGELNGQLNDPNIAAAATAVATTQGTMVSDFNAIDQKLAAAKAASDISFVKRTLNTLFKDLNLFSIGPAGVFDVTSIGPERASLGGTRIGPGGGIRVELASAVNFTLGYAWNVNQQPGEGPGAMFFSIGVRDLFH